MQLLETGMPRLWTDQQLPKADKCFAKNTGKTKVSRHPNPIKLEDLVSAFFILGIGFSLALLSFMVETLTHIYFRHRKANLENHKNILITKIRRAHHVVVAIAATNFNSKNTACTNLRESES